MRDRFPIHDEATAPEASRPLLAATRSAFGMVPNLEGVLAAAPAALEAYGVVSSMFDRSSLTDEERHVVALTTSLENDCTYCMPWHTLLAGRSALPPSAIHALRRGAPLADGRLEALRRFTSRIVTTRCRLVPADLELFLAAGFTPAQALEVLLGITTKTLSNYANALAATPLDPTVTRHRWHWPGAAD